MADRPDHPAAAIPLPAHGFATLDALDELPERELAATPAVEVVTRAAVLLVSAAAEKLGLTEGGAPSLDPGQARVLILALAGMLSASREELGASRAALVDGLRTLQAAYREAAAHAEPPGQGPGEDLIV